MKLVMLVLFFTAGSLSGTVAATQGDPQSLLGKSLYPTSEQSASIQSGNPANGDISSLPGQGLFRSTNYGDGFGDEELGVVTPIGEGIWYIVLLGGCYLLSRKDRLRKAD